MPGLRDGALPDSEAISLPASLSKARLAAQAAQAKKARGVVILDLRSLSSAFDYFVIASGASTRQVEAVADAVEEKLREAGVRPAHVEGNSDSRWVLLDYGAAVVHVFLEEARQFYDLERLWADARKVPVQPKPKAKPKSKAAQRAPRKRARQGRGARRKRPSS